MPRRRTSALAAPFQGKWRMAELEPWAEEAGDLEGGFIAFAGQRGEMGFATITAPLDVGYEARRGGPAAGFSWQGVAGGEPCSGREWVEPGTAGRSSATSSSTTATRPASSASHGGDGRDAPPALAPP